MRVLLVNMPWSPIDLPSLALGILQRGVNERTQDSVAETLHAHLEFVDWITRRTEFSKEDYEFYALASYLTGCGDWVFSSALYGDPAWRTREFTAALSGRLSEARMRMTHELHRIAPEFIAHVTERIAERAPDVVGFTSTFQQNTAALAAARHLKRLAPHTVTVLGGANCEAEQGAALHRNFPFVDFVVRGEGEAALPQLLTALGYGTDVSAIRGLCHRTPDGHSVANPMSASPPPPVAILPPDYTGYFERLASSTARTWVEPKLVVEGARGCWWGEKHQCTFCGLNGSFPQFRSKSPERFHEEIVELARRHHVLDLYVVDTILDMGHLTTLLPRLIDSGYDLRLHVEIKSDLRRSRLRTLAAAGLVHVQAAVESLNSRVLSLMGKGVSGCQNVRLLRDGAETGLSVAWNHLHGFPEETDADYAPVIAQIPALEHLEPPSDLSTRIAIERFSPYFDHPELGFSALRPERHYRFTYDLPERELHDLAHVFEAPPRGIGEATVTALNDALATWRKHHSEARLTHLDTGDRIILVSRRHAFAWHLEQLTDPVDTAAFRLLDQPHTPAALTRELTACLPDSAPTESEVHQLLQEWAALGLVFTDAGQYVHVAPAAGNEGLLRPDSLRHATPPALPHQVAART